MTARCIVTLIHGTQLFNWWGKPKVKWIEGDAPLARALRQSMGENDLRVQPFFWTGHNSDRARIAAAKELGSLLERDPDASHVLIAHSHGGNVALYALRDSISARRAIRGIAFLSTPFIIARHRALGIGQRVLVIAAAVISYAVVIWTLWGGWLDPLPQVLQRVVLLLLGLLVFLSALVAGGKWSNLSERIITTLALPDLRDKKVLFMRACGDEAGDSLGAAHGLSALVTRMWLWSSIPAVTAIAWQDRIAGLKRSRSKWWRGFGIATLVSSAGLFSMLFVTRGSHPLLLALLLLPVLGLLLLVTAESCVRAAGNFLGALAAVFALPAIAITALVAGLSYGPRAALGGLLVEISGEVVPPGDWTITLLDQPCHPLVSTDELMPALAHGTYDDVRVVRRLTTWVTEIMK